MYKMGQTSKARWAVDYRSTNEGAVHSPAVSPNQEDKDMTCLDDKIARAIFGAVQFLRFTLGLAEATVFLALTYLFIYLAPMAL